MMMRPDSETTLHIAGENEQQIKWRGPIPRMGETIYLSDGEWERSFQVLGVAYFKHEFGERCAYDTVIRCLEVMSRKVDDGIPT